MSATNIISKSLAEKCADLTLDDVKSLISAAAQGLGPAGVKSAIDAINDGREVLMPSQPGGPKPVTIIAWSFVNDKAQYGDTYGVTVVRSAELKDLLLKDVERGLEEIRKVVAEHPRTRVAGRAVMVSPLNIPGSAGVPGAPAPGDKGGLSVLKAEIRTRSGYYGMFKFVAEPTDRAGLLAFRVRLGGGFYATFQNKEGAVAVARIARAKGRSDPLVMDHVAFWRTGKSPLFGKDIPAAATFDCVLPPGVEPPADPVSVSQTVAPSPSSQSGN